MDETTDPRRRSWVDVPADSDFPLQNLPYGVMSRPGGTPRVGVAIGEQVVDLAVLADAGLLDVAAGMTEVLAAPTLNPLLARDRGVWGALRRRVADLLDHTDRVLQGSRLAEEALVPRDAVTMHLPFRPGDYVDFYSSEQHATNVGRMFRPDDDPLPPNWRHLPIAYHGRASTVVVDGTPVVRPRGQRRPEQPGGAPGFGPTRRLDFELEVGFVTGGAPNPPGRGIPTSRAAEHVFGFVLVNDWSARDVQAWEYRPLGPFLGKSFATTVSPWVVPLDALAPYRVPGPPQEPPPLPYLRTDEDWALDLELEVMLTPAGGRPTVVSRTHFRDMYWTPAQQLAHVTVNGTSIRPGDLYASGTVSGTGPRTYGSLLELSHNGERPLDLGDGAIRTFLEDGDTVELRGWAGGACRPRIGFGPCRGTILPAA